jgi:hypothetical protein
MARWISIWAITSLTGAVHAQTLEHAFQWGGEFLDEVSSGFGPRVSIGIDGTGAVYGFGQIQSDEDLDPGPGEFTLDNGPGFGVFKLDPNGTLVFADRIPATRGAERHTLPSGPTYSDGPMNLVVEEDGHFFVCASISTYNDQTSADFQPGPGEHIVALEPDTFYWYVAKFAPDGVLVFVKLFKTNSVMYGLVAPLIDPAGNIYTIFSFEETVDADPGPGVHELTETHQSNGLALVKLDPGGAFVYARRWESIDPTEQPTTSTYAIRVHAGDVGHDGSVYFCGQTRFRYDLDPGPGIFLTQTQPQPKDQVFIVHLDSNGDFMGGGNFSQLFSSPSQDWPYVIGIAAQPDGSIFYAGWFSGFVDFDPGPGTNVPQSESYPEPFEDLFLTRLTREAELIDLAHFEGDQPLSMNYPSDETMSNFVKDGAGNMYMTGNLSGVLDFDPGPGVHEVASTQELFDYGIIPHDAYLLKLRSDGSFEGVTILPAARFANGYGLAVNSHSGLALTGSFEVLVDLDPGPGEFLLMNEQDYDGNTDFGHEAFIVKLGPSAPYVVSVERMGPEITNETGVQFTVTFTQPVDGVDVSDFAVSTTGTIFGANVISVRGAGDEYTVAVSTGFGDGTVGLNVLDDDSIRAISDTALGDIGLGNGNFTGPTFTIDKTPPFLEIGPPSAGSTATGPVSYVVTYTDSTSISLSAGDVSLATAASVSGAVSILEYGANKRIVVVNGISGDGMLAISVVPGTALDAVGNAALGVGPSTAFTVDSAAMAVNIGPPSPFIAGPSPVQFEVTYDNASTITLSPSDVDLIETGTATGNVSVSGSAGSTRTVTIDNLAGNGTLAIDIDAGTAAGSGAAPAAGPSLAFAVDTSPPDVVGVYDAPAKGANKSFVVTFAEPVIGVDMSDFSVRAAIGASGAYVASVTGPSPSTVYTVSVDAGMGFGPLILAVEDDDTILDLAGNPLGGPGIGNGAFNQGPAVLPVAGSTLVIAVAIMLLGLGLVVLRRRTA